MDISVSSFLISGSGSPPGGGIQPRFSGAKPRAGTGRDVVALAAPPSGAGAAQTRLIKEIIEETDAGYRRTRTFEQADGRTFTRIEDVAATPRGAERNVIQQNASGSITRLQQVLERQDDGSFRRTSRFTDATGQSETKIETGLAGGDLFALTSLPQGPGFSYAANQNAARGHRLDLSA